jgi:hypothetical protein
MGWVKMIFPLWAKNFWWWDPSLPLYTVCSLFIVYVVARTWYGREMALASFDCQINTQSVPDGNGISKVATLVSDSPEKHLRHGIYDHQDCVVTITNWADAQLAGGETFKELCGCPSICKSKHK